MSNYIQISFENILPEVREMLIAILAEIGFEGFEETENSLKAFIPEDKFDKGSLDDFLGQLSIPYVETIIPAQNWNQSWESNFQPVVVDYFAAIRASFHKPISNVQYEILITPKMSFGTGHHATTYMMVQQMRTINHFGKTVFDFGTGTGILAILAEKLGAASVIAIDNDDWSIENATENIEANHCSKIKIGKSDTLNENTRYDIILANINKNVLLQNMKSLRDHLQHDGVLLMSGLLTTDETDILKSASENGLIMVNKTVRDNWISLRFINKS
ncbi:MAG: 50S ribosomal protein L11 methyltransferase [Bacteroidetes bacterium]|nr:50S ribosomal protein L11 methyltransferase [Bacteroidota bacterium]